MNDRKTSNLVTRARDRVDQGDLDGAVDALRELLALDPSHVFGHAMLALCFVDLHALPLAEREAEEALVLDPQCALAHRALASVRFAQRSFTAAATHLDAALELDPHDPSCYLAMAQLARVRDRPRRALLERAIALDPEDPDVLAALAEERLDQGQIDEARAFADEALGINPECTDALLAKARVLLRTGNLDDARHHIIAVLRQNAVDRDALSLLVQARARQNPALGLFMRWNLWLEFMGSTRTIAWMAGLYVATRLASQIALDLGLAQVASALDLLWLAFCGYTWVGPVILRRMLVRELGNIQLNEDY